MNVSFKNTPVKLVGAFPKIGDVAADFRMAKSDLGDITLKSLRGGRVVMNVFPSLDTPVCAMSVRRFNKIAADTGAKVLCISKDSPFALSRFCVAENINNALALSDCRYGSRFGESYGVQIAGGALDGLLSRAVFVVEPDGSISYAALSPEIAEEPDYAGILAFLWAGK